MKLLRELGLFHLASTHDGQLTQVCVILYAVCNKLSLRKVIPFSFETKLISIQNAYILCCVTLMFPFRREDELIRYRTRALDRYM